MFKKTTLSVLTFFCFTSLLVAQVGIGTTTPAPGATLDIDSNNGGILIPRIALTSTTSTVPISPPAPAVTPGVMVYNTANVNDVTEGFYYWNGAAWERMASGASTDWALTGNAGTTPGTAVGENYIGTSDAQDLVIATDGTERMRVLDDAIVVNTPAPLFAGDRFTVLGNAGESAINGYSSTDGFGVYGENTGTGVGVFGESTNIGIGGYGFYGGILESIHQNGFGAIISNLTNTGNGKALFVNGQNLGLLNYPYQTASLFYGSDIAITAFTNTSNATGIRAVGNGLTGSFSLPEGAGISGTGFKFGVFGYATETGVNNPQGDFSSAGGYFANAYGGWAAVGAWGDPPAPGNQADISFKILGPGVVSTIVKDTNEESVIMFAPESPEVLFQDYGIGNLSNGKASIKLDPILVKNIRVDDNHPLKVFIQLEGDCNGVYVTNKSANGFDVIELQGGNSNVSFSWSITATRADEVFKSRDGSERVSRNGVRFPIAPKILDFDTQYAKIQKEEIGIISSGLRKSFSSKKNPKNK